MHVTVEPVANIEELRKRMKQAKQKAALAMEAEVGGCASIHFGFEYFYRLA